MHLLKDSPASEIQKFEHGGPIKLEMRDLLEGSWREGGEQAEWLE